MLQIIIIKSISQQLFMMMSSLYLPYVQELESLNVEIERNIYDEGYFTEQKYPFVDEPNSSRLGSIIEASPRRKIHKSFIHDDSVRDFVGFKPAVIDKEHKISDNTVDILPIENNFHEIGIAQERILQGKITGVIHIFKRMLIRFKKISKDAKVVFNGIWGVVKNFFEKCFYRKYGNGDLVSFNRLSFFFWLSKKSFENWTTCY